jgi:hypothetical protein
MDVGAHGVTLRLNSDRGAETKTSHWQANRYLEFIIFAGQDPQCRTAWKPDLLQAAALDIVGIHGISEESRAQFIHRQAAPLPVPVCSPLQWRSCRKYLLLPIPCYYFQRRSCRKHGFPSATSSRLYPPCSLAIGGTDHMPSSSTLACYWRH